MNFNEKLLADLMLQRLGRILILAGYDVNIIKQPFKPLEIIEIAEKEKRIILTRNSKIKNYTTNCIILKEQKPYQQLKFLIENYKLQIDFSKVFTRCSLCNIQLEKIEKEKILSQIPPLTRMNTDEFFICRGCGRIYWKESHFDFFTKAIKNLVS